MSTTRKVIRWLPVGLSALLCSCLAYMPSDPRPDHMRIAWRIDVAQAVAAMQATGKPGLIVAVAGDIRGSC